MYVTGMLTLPLAVALLAKADLGLSMIAAPTFIISEKVSFLSYGQAEYIFQAIILAIMCAAVGRVKWVYLTSFASAVIYGTVLDGYIWLMKDWTVDAIWLRLLLFAAGILLTSFGVAAFMNTYLPPCAYDYFVRELVRERHLELKKVKLINDFTYLVLSAALSLALFRGFVGISLGTVVMAAANGFAISFFSNKMNTRLELFDRFGAARIFEGGRQK